MDLTEKHFHHPYTPYEIQLQFMRALYTCIEDGKVGIFESPTGTGKSLSLICGSVTWLRDHKRGTFFKDLDSSATEDEPQWMLEHSRRERIRTAVEKVQELEYRLKAVREREERQRRRYEEGGRPKKKRRLDIDGGKDTQQGETQFELNDYDSGAEEGGASKAARKDNDGLSADTLALLDKLKGTSSMHPDFQQDDDEIRIFYCSRTHSQLSQFAHELGGVQMDPSIPTDIQTESTSNPTDVRATLEEGMKHISLGSRKNLCINPKVQALSTSTAINERCLDLQKPGVASDHKCPFLPSKDNEVLVDEFRDHALAKVRDIEDIGKIGTKIGICPYYASRSVIKYSEIVTLPYPLLLQRSAREALGISVKNHVIVIDEAHNLMDAISNIYSVSVSLTQLNTAIFQLTTYARKYQTRLKGKNRVYVAQVLRLVQSIVGYLQSISGRQGLMEGSVLPSDLMAGRGVDQINMHKLSRYLHESKLARKVDGFIQNAKEAEESKQDPANKPSVPVLFQVQSFLLSLMNPSAEGRFFFDKTASDVDLKYMLLDPTNHFREIVDDARAIILAGGTMSPMEDYAHHLFSYVPVERLSMHSYGHVIPKENLLAWPLAKGIDGIEFDFTYEKRSSEAMILELGTTVTHMCSVIPDGIVVFFPSYEYLTRVLTVWSKPRQGKPGLSVLDAIGGIKTVFYETQDKATNTDELLQNYTNAIDKGKGALLLSVMGGKLSEGINFSDRLGRGVIMVGLPFPSLRSAVWQAKIAHIERKAYESCPKGTADEARKAQSKAAGREFYENSCMRTVNQCIGRAIRHRNDYAVIVMMDRRYSTSRIQKKLPGWIQESTESRPSRQSPAVHSVSAIANFFSMQRLKASEEN